MNQQLLNVVSTKPHGALKLLFNELYSTQDHCLRWESDVSLTLEIGIKLLKKCPFGLIEF